MNKKIICLIIVFLLIIILYFLIKLNEKTSHYSVENYLDYIKNNNYHYQVDVIEDYDSAVSVGEELFVQHFGKEILKERPFKVYYDESSTTWLISGQNKIAYSGSGGSAHAIIDKNGTVLAIWHDK